MNIKKIITCSLSTVVSVMLLSSVLLFRYSEYMTANAHTAQLEVEYDDCIPDYYNSFNDIGDGEDEKWYELVQSWNNGTGISHQTKHLPHTISTIKYYISDVSKENNTITWTSHLTNDRANYVKEKLINSIKKWNNIYFYNSSSGNLIKQKLVNIVEGTQDDFNLIIYPAYNVNHYGAANSYGDITYIDTTNDVPHYHANQWWIELDLKYHNPNESIYDFSTSEFVLERTGAHEFGHVLGLYDIDRCEEVTTGSQAGYSGYHHEEILMGYSQNLITMNRQSNITYKDLIGATITRGFHSDSEHSWMYDSNSSSFLHHKLICSICNGVKYVPWLNGMTYVTYKACNDNHTLSSGNMFAVASYGNKDYYKCKYCKYVAPFEDLVNQNYSYASISDYEHSITNQVNDLNYVFTDFHNMINGYCTDCGYHSHNYTFTSITQYSHTGYCTICNETIHGAHTVRSGPGLFKPCIICGYLVNIGTDPIIQGLTIMEVSDNGSYVLSNGIVVLVEQDIESYLNGTLVFHPANELLM